MKNGKSQSENLRLMFCAKRADLRISVISPFLRLIVLCLTLMIVAGCAGHANRSAPDLRFAFIGDLHYQIPEYSITEYFTPQLVRELAGEAAKPEFILLTGDFFHGSRNTDIEAEADFAFRHFSENVGLPFFVAKGNHDKREPFEKNALPIFSRELGRRIDGSYFSFDRGNCHFIVLDCTEKDLTAQLAWLEGDLREVCENPAIEHIFVAGHYPLWIVARAGFTRPDYAGPVAKLLARYNVDAYFCGHTHNHTTTVRVIDGTPVTQIMGAAVVDRGVMFALAPFLEHVRAEPENDRQPGLLALEEIHSILIPSQELRYYWGYQEGSNSCYFEITVKGAVVRVDYRVLGRGIVRSFQWEKPGDLGDIKKPVALCSAARKGKNAGLLFHKWCGGRSSGSRYGPAGILSALGQGRDTAEKVGARGDQKKQHALDP
jgi:predicted MPP superfamily phosphohydrolase